MRFGALSIDISADLPDPGAHQSYFDVYGSNQNFGWYGRQKGKQVESGDVFSKDEKTVHARFLFDGTEVIVRVAGVWWDIVLKCKARTTNPEVVLDGKLPVKPLGPVVRKPAAQSKQKPKAKPAVSKATPPEAATRGYNDQAKRY